MSPPPWPAPDTKVPACNLNAGHGNFFVEDQENFTDCRDRPDIVHMIRARILRFSPASATIIDNNFAHDSSEDAPGPDCHVNHVPGNYFAEARNNILDMRNIESTGAPANSRTQPPLPAPGGSSPHKGPVGQNTFHVNNGNDNYRLGLKVETQRGRRRPAPNPSAPRRGRHGQNPGILPHSQSEPLSGMVFNENLGNGNFFLGRQDNFRDLRNRDRVASAPISTHDETARLRNANPICAEHDRRKHAAYLRGSNNVFRVNAGSGNFIVGPSSTYVVDSDPEDF
ncbi:hypothetical protein HGRIS_005775 [Hohenbuehelia grisea]|uniref:Uncharacterized protein n=1 Tax=Hohenbuehelia grisea TaxID=104357 RepID=A0ABR3JXU4_9AGAR